LILIGYEQIPHGIPRSEVLFINGGHNVAGEEKEPLDLASLTENLEGFINVWWKTFLRVGN
jgi:hypothetical protein